MKLTHVTEIGLGLCAGLIARELWHANVDARKALRAHGLRPDTRACDGRRVVTPEADAVLSIVTPTTIPTCPRCAVLRDEALEGRLPKRGAA